MSWRYYHVFMDAVMLDVPGPVWAREIAVHGGSYNAYNIMAWDTFVPYGRGTQGIRYV